MNFEIGKVVTFDGYCGSIVSESGEYLFLNTDIDSNSRIEVGTLVAFRGEEVQGKKKAYFVKAAEEILHAGKSKEKIYHNL